MNFVIFVSKIEYFRKQDFSAIRGVKLFGDSKSLPLDFRVVGQHENSCMKIDEQNYKPKRTGMDGVFTSKITNEGIWTAKEKLDVDTKNVFVISDENNQDMTMQTYDFICEEPSCPSEFLEFIKNQYVPIKIYFDTVSLVGVMCFHESDAGKMYLIVNKGLASLSGELKTETIFEDLDSKTIHFNVMVDRA